VVVDDLIRCRVSRLDGEMRARRKRRSQLLEAAFTRVPASLKRRLGKATLLYGRNMTSQIRSILGEARNKECPFSAIS
jgi:hypothetical protein